MFRDTAVQVGVGVSDGRRVTKKKNPGPRPSRSQNYTGANTGGRIPGNYMYIVPREGG